MLLRRYDRKGVKQKEEQKQLHEQGLDQVETGEVRDETSVTVTEGEEGEESELPKYVKATNREELVEKLKQAQSEDYSTYSRDDLKSIKNDDLKEYLDGKEIEYASSANKEDLINAILGE